MKQQRVAIFGATGSIGDSTLRVIRKHPSLYDVYALTGHTNVSRLVELALEFQPKYLVVNDDQSAFAVSKALVERDMDINADINIVTGVEGLVYVASLPEVDTLVAGIVGVAGLAPTLAAARSGKKILLANKESMVMAGALFQEAIRAHHCQILPIDSEHNAIFQTLPHKAQTAALITQEDCESQGVSNIVLTASGGPFLRMTQEQLVNVSPQDACKHPNWSMGAKVSVDSASMMNKGLELIEACYLFGVQERFVKVVVHPQSIVHSMVTYVDGSTLAHLSHPSMEVPIGHGLAWPKRHDTNVTSLDWSEALSLTFEPLNVSQFPCFGLARQAMRSAEQNHCAAPAVLNSANEIAVAAFLRGDIAFLKIAPLVEQALSRFATTHCTHLDELVALDQQVREYSLSLIE